MPSERQSAEWGVRALNAPFGLLRLPLSASSRKHIYMLSTCFRLLNLRTREIGLNQIRTVYSNSTEDVQPWVHHLVEEQNQIGIDNFQGSTSLNESENEEK